MKMWNLSRLRGEELLLVSILNEAPQASIDEELDRRAVHGQASTRRRRTRNASHANRQRENAA